MVASDFSLFSFFFSSLQGYFSPIIILLFIIIIDYYKRFLISTKEFFYARLINIYNNYINHYKDNSPPIPFLFLVRSVPFLYWLKVCLFLYLLEINASPLASLLTFPTFHSKLFHFGKVNVFLIFLFFLYNTIIIYIICLIILN